MVYEYFNDDILNIEPRNKPMARCKKCGTRGFASDFRIHDDLGYMVCRNCFEEFEPVQKKKVDIKEPAERGVIPRTIVIRKEEDVLRSFGNSETVKPKKVPEKKDEEYSRVLCSKCGFRFRYNERKNWPNVCPACGRDMKMIKRGIYSL